MQEISYVLTESHEIDSTIHAPINATQRIKVHSHQQEQEQKYTCLTTSLSYIAVGSTSGSVYLFSREPCSFIHLVPLSEGAVTHVQISPDEKLIALATIRGMVCLMALKPSIKLIGISSEHAGERVECICWNENSSEVYIGDANGKVSVIVNSIFTVNGMFQAPTCALMSLDSSVVQMCYESSLLLISTLTRCYLCNTLLEQYKQIGNQSRDGEFGACFFKLADTVTTFTNSEDEKMHKITSKLRTFDFISETDSSSLDESVKIYCARPGSRLWEVNTNGVVVKTHQFKEALAISAQPIYKLICAKSLKIDKSDKVSHPQSVQFCRLYVLQNKYIFSYAPTGIYIIDPNNAQVILWSGDIKNINCVSIVGDKIYIMTRCGYFRCLNFTSINSFILKLHEQKLYNECMKAAKMFKPHVIDREFNENDLDQLISLIKYNQNAKKNGRINGIVVVNSGAQSIQISNNYTSDSEDILVQPKTKSETKVNKNGVYQQTNDNKDKRILCEVQEKLKLVYSLIEDLKFITIDDQLERKVTKIRNTLEVTRNDYESEISGGLTLVFRTTELHFNNVFMENISTDLIEQTERWNLVKLIEDIFVKMNIRRSDNCSCGSALISYDSNEIKFADIGVALLRKYINTDEKACLNLCSNVPFLWREYINHCDKSLFTADDMLQKLLQTRDKQIIAVIFRNLPVDKWNLVMQLTKKLEEGRCLNCDNIITETNDDVMFNWSDIAGEINRTCGPEKALKFMYQVNELSPDVKFESWVMQQLIFMKILSQHGVVQGINFDSATTKNNYAICSPEMRDELIPLIEKETGVTIDKAAFGSGSHHWGMQCTMKNAICPCCTLSLETPVLLGNNGIALFPCGHAYHVNCMIKKKFSRCNLHSK